MLELLKVKRLRRATLAGLLDVLFPPSCVACARVLPGDGFFCEGCSLELERLPDERCVRCAEPGDFRHDTCPRCLERPPPFARAFAPFAHEGAVARAIHQFKYEDHPELAASLGALLVRQSRAFLREAPTYVAAIPLHRTRFRKRRYDQAELLVGELCETTGRVRLEALERVRETNRQVGLTEARREANVRDAFQAREDVVQGRSILLIDDVFTTGATARAAANALKNSGAERVEVLTLARAFTL